MCRFIAQHKTTGRYCTLVALAMMSRGRDVPGVDMWSDDIADAERITLEQAAVGVATTRNMTFTPVLEQQ